ncbi:hypothetical protein M501DRAFT_994546 [Patellaria atrata CBS 101060]|uniref:Uncharacterized protein n=1 Tax=Patellaria atrata CBS 101060 TaxID=1346257 RepID=A0A9P4SIH2_9PEZI|nr:hypothetical protein M501DRAFT_994546 [Patellaria atrata CBS 101060]
MTSFLPFYPFLKVINLLLLFFPFSSSTTHLRMHLRVASSAPTLLLQEKNASNCR